MPTENSFRDVNIAFANELSLICADQGINVWELIRLANRHLALIFFSLALAWAATALLLIRGLSWHRTPAGAAYPYRARSERSQTVLGYGSGESGGG